MEATRHAAISRFLQFASVAAVVPDDHRQIQAEPIAYDIGTDETSVSVTCELTRDRQLDAVTEVTDLVLFTIGGNDGNFSGIIRNCFLFTGTIDPVQDWLTAYWCRHTVDDVRAERSQEEC